MSNEAVLITEGNILIPYGTFNIIDEGHEFGRRAHSFNGTMSRGSSEGQNVAYLYTPCDYARATVRVFNGCACPLGKLQPRSVVSINH